jgi:hypothetical protein
VRQTTASASDGAAAAASGSADAAQPRNEAHWKRRRTVRVGTPWRMSLGGGKFSGKFLGSW